MLIANMPIITNPQPEDYVVGQKTSTGEAGRIPVSAIGGRSGEGGESEGTPGLSAYQVAVANGFSGTQTQWLASLVGPAGTNGINGTNGTNGINGTSPTNAQLTALITPLIPAPIKGDKGDKGDTGDPGATTIAGISGLQAALDAKQPLAAVLTGTTASFTTAKDTKLSGIATGATANDTDANLKARANHTGTQLAATISDFATAALAAAPAETAATIKTALGISVLSGSNTGDQDLSGLAPKASPTFTGTVSGITKAMVGLGNVDNTADASKPVSTAQQAALDLKAPLASPTFTGTVSGITKAMVGLGSVDNTADTAKPVSTAQQTALNLKADLNSPALVTPNIGAATGTSLAASGVVTAAGGIGYGTGAGGAVTQATSRTTGVTLSKLSGAITLFSKTTTAGLVDTFTVTNTLVAATDLIVVNVKSGTGIYILSVSNVAAGSFKISVHTPAAVASAEAPVISFAVIKGVIA